MPEEQLVRSARKQAQESSWHGSCVVLVSALEMRQWHKLRERQMSSLSLGTVVTVELHGLDSNTVSAMSRAWSNCRDCKTITSALHVNGSEMSFVAPMVGSIQHLTCAIWTASMIKWSSSIGFAETWPLLRSALSALPNNQQDEIDSLSLEDL